MAIRVKCPNPACGKEYNLKDDLAGKTVKCNACGQSFRVPVPAGPPGADGGTVLLGREATKPPQPPVQSATSPNATPASVQSAIGTPQSAMPSPGVPPNPEPRTLNPDPLIGTKIAHYRIQSLLGKGGMGKVYKAHNTSLDKTCAVKVLPPEFAEQDESAIARFVREARAAAKVEHTNVLPVHFVGKMGQNYFIEMQYVDGGTLEGLLKRKGKLGVKEAAEIIRDVAAGLNAAHKKGIIHRDMKPGNVMLTSEGHVYVMDFGLAKVAQARTRLTVSGTIMGTPLYMSPEQAKAQPVDHRGDIYSLGVMFYQILSGNPPYNADSAMALIGQHVHAPVPDLAQVAPDVPPAIAAMIRKMMAKDPKDRYQSCAEIVQELNAFLTPGTAAPAAKKRSAMPVVLVLVLLLALVLGLYFLKGKFTAETRRARRTETAETTKPALSKAEGTQSTPRTETPRGSVAQPPSAVPPEQPARSSWDEVYVTTAATGEKIPHPLSRKTYKQALADGTTVDVPEGMVYVPAGEFTMGNSDKPPEGPQHRVYLDAFFIGKYEVTNAEWKAFVDATNFNPPPQHWKAGAIPAGKDNHPVVNVSWEDAQRYCEWVTKGTGRETGLPTEAQWQKAARGPEGYIYPWGNTWDKDLCNSGYLLAPFGFRPTDEADDWTRKWLEWRKTEKSQEVMAAGGNTMPVGSFPKGKSPYGCYDMAGNVHEWCRDWYLSNYFSLSHTNRNPEGPTEEQAEVMDFAGQKSKARVLHGGYWYHASANCRTVHRNYQSPSLRALWHGFRVVARPPAKEVGPVATPEPAASPVQAATAPTRSAWDDACVTTAATGEKIPHPLSRKTYKQTLADGTTVDVPEGTVYVPAGEFTMGEKETEHKVYLDAFFIGKYEVTNAEWKAFVEVGGFTPPSHWRDGRIPAGRENHPVVQVSWGDAQKYCGWATRLRQGFSGPGAGTAWEVRLATEAQWEKAARGPAALKFPWGNTWDKDLCNNAWLLAPFGLHFTGEGEDYGKKLDEWRKSDAGREADRPGGNTTPVGSFPKGKSFYGCHDMAGNVFEWCDDWFMTDYYKLKDANRNPQGPTEEQAEEIVVDGAKGTKSKTRLLRGGSWMTPSSSCRTVARNHVQSDYRNTSFGLRIVVCPAR